MKKGYLIAGIVLIVLSLLCIGSTAVEVLIGRYGMGALRFWLAVPFHALTMIAAAFLLDAARSADEDAEHTQAAGGDRKEAAS